VSKHIASQELIGNPVIGISRGEMIAKVADVQIDPNILKAAVAITSRGSLLDREIEAISADHENH
jgi:uncharacterized protein YrrD